MMKQTRKQDSEAELEEQAIQCLCDKEYENAIALTRRLLRRKPRCPLYYLILSDCCKGIAIRDNDLRASENSERYWRRAWAPDGKFMRSDYWQQGIEAAGRYLLATQDLEKLTEIETKKLQALAGKQVTFGDFRDAVLGQASISEDPAVRLASLNRDLALSKAGLNQNLYAFDLQGNVVNPTIQEFVRIKSEDPKRQLLFILSTRDPLTGEETRFPFNVLKNFTPDTPSQSVIKARQRRRRYYYKHQNERQEYQRLYDSKNRQRKRVRNKLDYSWRKSGMTRKYWAREP